MTYDFHTVLDRRGQNIIAAAEVPFRDAEGGEGVSAIPMWIADMSFPTAPWHTGGH